MLFKERNPLFTSCQQKRRHLFHIYMVQESMQTFQCKVSNRLSQILNSSTGFCSLCCVKCVIYPSFFILYWKFILQRRCHHLTKPHVSWKWKFRYGCRDFWWDDELVICTGMHSLDSYQIKCNVLHGQLPLSWNCQNAILILCIYLRLFLIPLKTFPLRICLWVSLVVISSRQQGQHV